MERMRGEIGKITDKGVGETRVEGGEDLRDGPRLRGVGAGVGRVVRYPPLGERRWSVRGSSAKRRVRDQGW